MKNKHTSIIEQVAIPGILVSILIIIFELTVGYKAVRKEVYRAYEDVFSVEAESVSLILIGVDQDPTAEKYEEKFEPVEWLCASETIQSIEFIRVDESGNNGKLVCRADDNGYELTQDAESFPLSENERKLVSEEEKELIETSPASDSVCYSQLVVSISTGAKYLLRISYSMANINAMVRKVFLENNAVYLGLSLVLLAVLLAWMFYKIVFPLRRISRTMSGLISDNTLHEERLPVEGSNEIAMLSADFNRMQDNLNDYVKRVDSMAKAEEAENAQKEIAARIQRSLLEPGKKAFPFAEVESAMMPARYVGGDFYDCFEMNRGKVCVLIADVSGKGIPAALFMSASLSAIRCMAMNEESPARILQNANAQLCRHNEQMQFLTAFLAVWDPQTGCLTYANAGHNPPYLLGKTLHKLDDNHGLMMGVFENEVYEDTVAVPKAGSSLFLFTDGVNETVNEQNEFFGTERLEECLMACAENGQKDLIGAVSEALTSFRKEAEQHDDVTMLTLCMEREAKFSCPAETENFAKLKKWLFSFPEIPESLRKKICLALEEVFANICSYAYPEKQGSVQICIRFEKESMVLRISDEGIPYDPTRETASAEDYDPDLHIGGLGKLLVKSLMDEVHYEYVNHCNELTLIKNLAEDGIQ